MLVLLTTIHIVICLFLILVVLLQQGSGADLSVFGGGGTQTVFGARGTATLLHKLTVWSFVAFIVTTIAIGFIKSSGTRGSVMTGAATEEAAPAEAPAESPAATGEAAPAESAAPAADETAPAESGAAAPEGAETTPPAAPESPPGG